MDQMTERESLIKLSTQLDSVIATVNETRGDVKELSVKVDSVEARMRGEFVTKMEFEPIKKLVYGVSGLILTAVIIALLALVISNGVYTVIP